MILFTIIMIILVSSIFRPRYYGWFEPRFYRPFYRRGPMMRGPRPMGPGHGPSRMHGGGHGPGPGRR